MIAMTELEQLRAEVQELRRHREVLVKWAEYSAEEDPKQKCRLDHDGACQSHGGGSPCQFKDMAEIIRASKHRRRA